MPAKIKHIAIVSDQYALEGRFYEAVFGMRSAADRRPERAVTVSDGTVGLNINPRKAGRPAGLDHFGVEVEDAERVCARLREHYPAIEVLKRPGTRPFAGISTHDPAGNLFDLSQKDMQNRTSVYVEPPREQPRAIRNCAPSPWARDLRAKRGSRFSSAAPAVPITSPTPTACCSTSPRSSRATMKENFIEVEGLRIRTFEEGSGPAVLLLHGASLGSSADVWAGNLADLAAHGLRVIACDQPGFGLSDNPGDLSVAYRTRF